MATKVTFTLDDETVDRVRKLAQRNRKPQSQIVREAVAYYQAREDKLSPEEKERILDILKTFASQLPVRTPEDVAGELNEIRQSRRGGYSRPWDRVE